MRNDTTVSAIILAAGSSLRFGNENKLEVCLCGKSVLYHAVRAFEQCAVLDEIIIVTKADMTEGVAKAYRSNGKVRVIAGGESRNASSLCGLRAAKGDIVLIHDGARPFVDEEIILRCIDGAIETGAVAAAVQATDTIKLCDDDGLVRETTRRSNTWRTQSPQAFRRLTLLSAYETTDTSDVAITDDCMVMEHSGKAVKLVEGSNYNIKITTRADLTMAESIAKELGWGGLPRTCSAIGQDSHRTSSQPTDKPMILGGVIFEDYPALVANSDGDVVLHALTNAISGLTCENVLGARADAICFGGQRDSSAYLREALKYLRGRITHLSFTIECKEPHISPKIAEMRSSIGEL
ncbi:MAG: 2-C-methyl-D-erythritol 4-phosphate cytidylyltransferase, partial [Angelakisella sp.]